MRRTTITHITRGENQIFFDEPSHARPRQKFVPILPLGRVCGGSENGGGGGDWWVSGAYLGYQGWKASGTPDERARGADVTMVTGGR